MEYIYLGISLLAGAGKGLCTKKISNIVKTFKGTVYITMIRMVLCVAIGFFAVAASGINNFATNLQVLMISALSGISTSAFIIAWIACVRKGSYVMLDVFTMLGVGITVTLCKVFFDEPISTNQYAGFLLLLVSTIIMCSYNSSIKTKLSIKSLFMLIICCIFSGISDFSQKLFIYKAVNPNIATFNFYSYVFSAIFLFICNFIKNHEHHDGKNQRAILLILLTALCLFANTYFKTLAARSINSAVLYPLATGINFILSVIMSSVFFKEKATLKCIIGVSITFISLIIINL